MLLNIHKPGEKCARTALYIVRDEKFRGTGQYEFVHRGREFPRDVGRRDTYWLFLDL